MISVSPTLTLVLLLLTFPSTGEKGVAEGSRSSGSQSSGKNEYSNKQEATSDVVDCCSTHLNATAENSRVLHSPNHPNNYPRESECWWTITAPPSFHIMINVTSFELEQDYDFLQVYDTPSQAEAAQPYVTIISNDVSSASILSNSNYFTIKFTSDDTTEMKGFKLTYRAVVIACPTLPTPLKGGKVCYVSNTNKIYCKFSCNHRFELSGSERRWCDSNGNWTGREVTCVWGTTCEELPVLEFGTKRCTDGINLGSVCNFTCNNGYGMRGSESRTCSRDNMLWSGYKTFCSGCGPSNLNATIESSRSLKSPKVPDIKPNEECWWTITAPRGYHIIINFTTFDLFYEHDIQVYDAALETKEFSIANATRKESTQPFKSITSADVSSPNFLSYSNYVTLKFTSYGDIQQNSGERFELSYRATSVNVACPTLSSPSNGGQLYYFGKGNTFYSNFFCKVNFKLSGSERRWCKSDGNWTGNEVTCEEIKSCVELPVPEHGIKTCTDGNNVSSTCNFTCDDEYEMFGSKSRSCSRNYEWSIGEDISCQGSPPTPTCDLDRQFICDGYYHCDDQSDEKECICPHNKFKCDCFGTGPRHTCRCLHSSSLCDGHNDCSDKSDERNCQCSDTRFQCKYGECIDRSQVNDGNIDCVLGDDEFICNKTQGHVSCDCMHDNNRCTSSGRCIPNSWIGDAIPDCENGSEEPCNASKVWCDECWVMINKCSTNQSKNILVKNLFNNTTRCHRLAIPSQQTRTFETNWICITSPCGKCLDMFYCDSGQITDNENFCEGNENCSDASDDHLKEFGFRCSGKSRKSVCVLPQKNVYDNLAQCSDESDLCFVNGEFRCFSCLDGKLIVSAKQVCDGIVDCYDMSDECLCANQTVCNAVLGEEKSRCPSNQMHCYNGTDCVDMDGVLCNSSVNCKSGNNQMCCHQDHQPSGRYNCPFKWFNYKYFLTSQVAIRCDGRPECLDMSDECEGCKPRPSFCDGLCAKEAIGTSSGNNVCNGVIDSVSYANQSCDHEVERYCPMRFYCKRKDKISIDKRLVCDGILDCDDHSDENNTDCRNKRFYCLKGNDVSIDKAFVCDGIKDCDKGEDEDSQLCGKSVALFSDEYEMVANPILRALFWIMGIFALIGNIFTGINIAKRLFAYKINNPVKLANDIFILNLTISDFLMGVYLIAVVAQGQKYSGYYGLVDKKWRSSNFCSGLGTLAVLSSETSTFIMATMSTFRLATVVRPFSTNYIKSKWIIIAGCSCWLISSLLAAIPWFPFGSGYFISKVWFPNLVFKTNTISKSDMFSLAKRVSGENSDLKSWFEVKEIVSDAFKYNPIKGEFGYYDETSVCMPRIYATTNEAAWQYSAFLITLNFLLFIYMVVAYVLVYKKVDDMSQSRSTKKDPNKGMQKRISRLLLTDFCCWIPVCMMGYLSVAGVSLPPNAYLASAGFLLPINSAMNPILYSKFIGQQASRTKKWFIQNISCYRVFAADEDATVGKREATELRVIKVDN